MGKEKEVLVREYVLKETVLLEKITSRIISVIEGREPGKYRFEVRVKVFSIEEEKKR